MPGLWTVWYKIIGNFQIHNPFCSTHLPHLLCPFWLLCCCLWCNAWKYQWRKGGEGQIDSFSQAPKLLRLTGNVKCHTMSFQESGTSCPQPTACVPRKGFHPAGINTLSHAGGTVKSGFICLNLMWGLVWSRQENCAVLQTTGQFPACWSYTLCPHTLVHWWV